MISNRLQILFLIAIALYYVVLFYLLKKKSLSLKYTLLWLFSGLVMLVFVLFPELLTMFAALAGVGVPTNALFAIISFCIIMLLISITSIVSKQTERIKILTQTLAILENRVRELERKNTNDIATSECKDS